MNNNACIETISLAHKHSHSCTDSAQAQKTQKYTSTKKNGHKSTPSQTFVPGCVYNTHQLFWVVCLHFVQLVSELLLVVYVIVCPFILLMFFPFIIVKRWSLCICICCESITYVFSALLSTKCYINTKSHVVSFFETSIIINIYPA